MTQVKLLLAGPDDKLPASKLPPTAARLNSSGQVVDANNVPVSGATTVDALTDAGATGRAVAKAATVSEAYSALNVHQPNGLARLNASGLVINADDSVAGSQAAAGQMYVRVGRNAPRTDANGTPLPDPPYAYVTWVLTPAEDALGLPINYRPGDFPEVRSNQTG